MGSLYKSSFCFGLMDFLRLCPPFDELPLPQFSGLSTLSSTSGRLLGWLTNVAALPTLLAFNCQSSWGCFFCRSPILHLLILPLTLCSMTAVQAVGNLMFYSWIPIWDPMSLGHVSWEGQGHPLLLYKSSVIIWTIECTWWLM